MNRKALLPLALVALIGVAAVVFVLAGRSSTGDDPIALPTSTANVTTASPATEAPVDTEPPGTDTTTTTPAAATTTTAAAETYEAAFRESLCEFDVVTSLDFSCGFLTVPEDRQNIANGKTVDLHVAIFETPNDTDPADPIVYLDGGPGGESLATLQFSLEATWGGFIENRDVIFFDQRGTGLSTPSLKCEETRELSLDTLDDALEPSEYVALELAALTECRDRLAADGIDLTNYNSQENAADVADLRVALGYDEWNLLGISYGTRLAETVMRDHPEGVRSVILDSTYTPNVDLVTTAPDNFERALGVFFSSCEADAACNTAYPDLETTLFEAIDTLDANPVTGELTDFLSGETYTTVFDGQTLLGSVFSGLYSEKVFPLLPRIITELAAGDTSTIEPIASNDLASGTFFSYGMHLSVQCNEEVPFIDEAEVLAASARYERLTEFFASASNIGPPVFDICELWDAGVGDPIENEAVISDIPTLVLAGSFDPITPPEWGEIAAETLSNSQFVLVPVLGHGISVGGACPEGITISFIDNPTAPVDTGCVSEMAPVSWSIPGTPQVVNVNLVPFERDVFGTLVTGIIPDSWSSVSPGAWARSETFIDEVAIVQQAVGFVATAEELAGSVVPFDSDPELIGIVTAGDREWTLYRGTLEGSLVDLAIGDDGSSTGIVLLVSDEESRDELIEKVFNPALEAFRTP